MNIWCFNEPLFDNNGKFIGNKLVEITEEKILNDFWCTWEYFMEQKYGKNHYLINPIACIEEWVKINKAWLKLY